MCTQLHERLRLARERRGMSLATIARQCGVREQNLLLIEQDRFEELPDGSLRPCAVRAYATAVGIPADEALAEVIDRLRAPEDPLDGLARVRGLTRQPERTFKEILHVPAPEVSLSSSTRAHVANAVDGLVLLGRRLPAARADGGGGRRARDRSAARRGAVDAGALRARSQRSTSCCSAVSRARRSARRSRTRRSTPRWSKASSGCCACGESDPGTLNRDCPRAQP